MTAEQPAKATEPETPGPKWATSTVCTTPATVDRCREDYAAAADLRAKFDERAKRQHGR
ncbi:hypothetical protein [Streptomyces sp. V1I6]|uniref:hypothetical protein n=1 Tax=Streptomyces sp. V1I6 TaxID=3042273 RepID=UPI0027867592|nr:hypothetical protein [Streptomyces sp. V1I6]MDQ0842426.1 hypothetical protein [Streptomyces sp. V1I6]